MDAVNFLLTLPKKNETTLSSVTSKKKMLWSLFIQSPIVLNVSLKYNMRLEDCFTSFH